MGAIILALTAAAVQDGDEPAALGVARAARACDYITPDGFKKLVHIIRADIAAQEEEEPATETIVL